MQKGWGHDERHKVVTGQVAQSLSREKRGVSKRSGISCLLLSLLRSKGTPQLEKGLVLMATRQAN